MNAIYDNVLKNMSKTLLVFEKSVPPPQIKQMHSSFVFRYLEKTIEQALVQKLARIITGLHSSRLLLENGFLQEQAAVQRMLDEFIEDVLFLGYANILNNKTKLHQDYLDAFYEEEFDAPTPMKSTQKRPMIRREKIRAFVANSDLAGIDPSSGIELSRTINKTYSGFIHGASPHIMDLYDGNPLQFHVNGMKGTQRQTEQRYDLWNYFYRGIVAFGISAKAFGNEALFRSIHKFLIDFDEISKKKNASNA